MATALEHVVQVNEGAKAIRKYAFEVSLSALGAIVRSTRSGTHLRGFNEVAMQMRDWSRSLEGAVLQVTVLSAERVQRVSDLARRARMAALLEQACRETSARPLLAEAIRVEQFEIANQRRKLETAGGALGIALDTIAQLGLMASVLSRAALIEAASGTDAQRRELTIASQEFAGYAERVNEAIAEIRARHRSAST